MPHHGDVQVRGRRARRSRGIPATESGGRPGGKVDASPAAALHQDPEANGGGPKSGALRGATLGALLLVGALAGCGGPGEPAPAAIHLVDLYEPASVTGSPASQAAQPSSTEWRFDAAEPPAEGRAWSGLHHVSGLAIRDGRLSGTASGDLPILHVESEVDAGSQDVLHAIELRLRVSAGSRLAVGFSAEEKLDPAKVVTAALEFPWKDTSPLVPGEAIQTYTITPWRPHPIKGLRHVLLAPTDASGARFELQSLRLISRREHLARVQSGVSWQGLAEIYRESIVSRSPETIRFNLTIPRDAFLDLDVGSLEDGPVTFRVSAAEAGGRSGEERVLLDRTLTRSHRWETAQVDLAGLAGREVTLALSLSAARDGALGLWGAPAVRRRAAAREGSSATASTAPRGVILIWADTLRRDHLSVYGYERETTPVLSRMAAEGALFSSCVVNGTWTKVSTPSLMTSLHPATHGVLDFLDRLPAGVTTLAEHYREAGHATLSMSSILFTGKMTNLHQGFEVLHEDTSLPDQSSSKTAREYLDRLLPWLEAHRDVPFFVFLHVSDPHDPYKPYPPYDAMWADASKEEQHEADLERAREEIEDPLLRRFGMPTREEMERAGVDADAYAAHDRDWYDGSIRAMDAEIGRLLERLRALGLDRSTLVVFAGDHGEEFLEHGRMFHGQSVYGELTNVPLILWQPGAVPAGAVVGETVQMIDVMPTLLEASGLPPAEGLQGRSLIPLLRGEEGDGLRAAGDTESRMAFVEKNSTTAADGSPPPRDVESFAVLDGAWKLVHHTKAPPGRPEFELFDLREDPLNRTNLAADHPDVVSRLAAVLEEHLAAARAARVQTDEEAGQSLSAEELERLRSLGYVQ